jgi:hypothetical protein
MTTIGKILVILCFVFSLVVGAFIIMGFSVSTNWEAGYRKLKANFDISEANNRAYIMESNEIRNKAEADAKRLNGEIARKVQDLKDLQAKVDKAVADRDDLHNQLKKIEISQQNTTQELQRSKDENKQLQAQVTDREKKIVELAKTAKTQQDNAVQADIRARSFSERLKVVTTALENATRENELLKKGTTGVRGQIVSRPPPEDVEGIVKNTDARSGLVTISIGSDAGISKGNSLYIYRLSPKPLYLGEIQILDVNPHEAVGRPVMAQRGNQVQSGDIVASQITNGSR